MENVDSGDGVSHRCFHLCPALPRHICTLLFALRLTTCYGNGSLIPLIERFNVSETRQFWRKTLFQVMAVVTGVAINCAALPLAWGGCFQYGVDPLW